MNWDTVFEWIGRFAVVLIFVGSFGVWLAKTYIDKWLSKRFQSQLDGLKHLQALEIAKLQLAIDAKLHRATKLHEREFEILPKAWFMLGETGGAIQLLIDPDQTHTDVDKLDPLALREFLGPLPLSDAEKQAISETPVGGRTRLFVERKLRHQMVEASTLAQAFHNYIAGKGVFIEPTLRRKLLKLSEVFDEVVRSHSILVVHGGPPKVDTSALNRGKLKATSTLIHDIGEAISERIWGASRIED